MTSFAGPARRRTAEGMQHAADLIGCELAALKAVIEVETKGSGFDSLGRPRILFEPHVFYRNLTGAKRTAAVKAGLAYRDWKPGAYGPNSAQYPRLAKAMAIDRVAALKACSWGLPQILGENHRAAGFDSVDAMVDAFEEGEDEQLAAMADFVKASKLDGFLRRKQWAAFAKGYNGAGYKANTYDVKLADAYRKHSIRTAAVGIASLPADDQVDEDQAPAEDLETPPDAELVTFAQTRLRALRYFDVGEIDGKFGSRTRGALLAFKADQGLPLTAEIDDATVKALAVAAPRQVDEDRANATAADLKGKSTIVATTGQSKKLSLFQAIAAGVTTLIYGIVDFFGDAMDKLGPLKTVITDVPGWAWAAGATGIALVLYANSSKVQARRVEDYRTGKVP